MHQRFFSPAGWGAAQFSGRISNTFAPIAASCWCVGFAHRMLWRPQGPCHSRRWKRAACWGHCGLRATRWWMQMVTWTEQTCKFWSGKYCVMCTPVMSPNVPKNCFSSSSSSSSSSTTTFEANPWGSRVSIGPDSILHMSPAAWIARQWCPWHFESKLWVSMWYDSPGTLTQCNPIPWCLGHKKKPAKKTESKDMITYFLHIHIYYIFILWLNYIYILYAYHLYIRMPHLYIQYTYIYIYMWCI